jgi:hypothetical protein
MLHGYVSDFCKIIHQSFWDFLPSMRVDKQIYLNDSLSIFVLNDAENRSL